ncbi:MAG: SapC family protein [Rhodanobacter sp.]
MKQLLIYARPIVLNRTRDRELRIKPRIDGYAFARDINSVPLVAGEFAAAARHYPIVFAGSDADNLMPAALLGLHGEQNLFVDADGQWAEHTYIPMFLRRYPFVVADREDSDEDFSVCIDESFVDDSDDAVRLFDDAGKDTPVLTQAVRFLSDYQAGVRATRTFVQHLVEHKLLIEKTLTVTRSDSDPQTLNGFSVVDEKSLQNLAQRPLQKLSKAGSLGLAYVHLMSLGNVQLLSSRLDKQLRVSG